MIDYRPSASRGAFDHGWLNTKHSFSFARYFDPDRMGFRSLRVINEDKVAPSRGFGTHSHADMEIFSLVLSGELQHQDSLGNGAVLRPGDFQYMSAGSGIEHSEFNPSADQPVHFYQVWIEPSEKGQPPRYKQTVLNTTSSGWQRLASGLEELEAPIAIRQSAVIEHGRIASGESLAKTLDEDSGLWLQVLSGHGSLRELNTSDVIELAVGDGIAISDVPEVAISAGEEPLELLAFRFSDRAASN